MRGISTASNSAEPKLVCTIVIIALHTVLNADQLHTHIRHHHRRGALRRRRPRSQDESLVCWRRPLFPPPPPPPPPSTPHTHNIFTQYHTAELKQYDIVVYTFLKLRFAAHPVLAGRRIQARPRRIHLEASHSIRGVVVERETAASTLLPAWRWHAVNAGWFDRSWHAYCLRVAFFVPKYVGAVAL